MMPDQSTVLSFPSVRLRRGTPVFQTVHANPFGPIVGLQPANGAHANAQFRTFSGTVDDVTGRRLTQSEKNGRIPAGTWYISKINEYGNVPRRIAQKMVSEKVVGMEARDHSIELRSRSYWLALYRDDTATGGFIDDETTVNGVKRDRVRFHYGRLSYGCLTFRKHEEYLTVMKTLAKSPAQYIDRTGKTVSPDTPNRIEVYGKLIVTEEPAPPPTIPENPILRRN